MYPFRNQNWGTFGFGFSCGTNDTNLKWHDFPNFNGRQTKYCFQTISRSILWGPWLLGQFIQQLLRHICSKVAKQHFHLGLAWLRMKTPQHLYSATLTVIFSGFPANSFFKPNKISESSSAVTSLFPPTVGMHICAVSHWVPAFSLIY